MLMVLRQMRFVALTLLLLCFVGAGTYIWHSKALQPSANNEAEEQLRLDVRDGVGTEVKFARQGDDKRNVRSSVESVAHFLSGRSNVTLNGRTKTRLAEMEGRTLTGQNRRITPDELSSILAVIAIEGITELSDAEINQTAETLRGFNAPDLPEGFKRGRDKIKLRSYRTENLTPEQFVEQAKEIKTANDTTRSLFRGAAKNTISVELRNRLKLFGNTVPEQFDPNMPGLTPLQAMLLTYSVAADDPLSFSNKNLHKKMRDRQQSIEGKIRGSYPSPDNRFAYGVNGYLFSTPLDLVFNDVTVNRLLDEFGERSAIR